MPLDRDPIRGVRTSYGIYETADPLGGRLPTHGNVKEFKFSASAQNLKDNLGYLPIGGKLLDVQAKITEAFSTGVGDLVVGERNAELSNNFIKIPHTALGTVGEIAHNTVFNGFYTGYIPYTHEISVNIGDVSLLDDRTDDQYWFGNPVDRVLWETDHWEITTHSGLEAGDPLFLDTIDHPIDLNWYEPRPNEIVITFYNPSNQVFSFDGIVAFSVQQDLLGEVDIVNIPPMSTQEVHIDCSASPAGKVLNSVIMFPPITLEDAPIHITQIQAGDPAIPVDLDVGKIEIQGRFIDLKGE